MVFRNWLAGVRGFGKTIGCTMLAGGRRSRAASKTGSRRKADLKSVEVLETRQLLTASMNADASSAFSQPENSSDVYTFQASDADNSELQYTYTTSGVDADAFDIDSTTGELSFGSSPDFENPIDSNHDNSYLLTVTAEDQFGGTVSSDVTVTVTGVNDRTPKFTSGSTASISETPSDGAHGKGGLPEPKDAFGLLGSSTVAYQASATDADLLADGITHQSVTYTITGGADAGLFSIDKTDGSLSFVSAPDFEHPLGHGTDGNHYVVRVAATDVSAEGADGPARKAERVVTISVVNVNEAPVAQPIEASAFEDGGSVDGTLVATDVDSGDTANLTYAIADDLVAGQGSVSISGNTFTFDPGTDFQDLAEGATRDVSFTYTATDPIGAVSAAATVTITVTGKNDSADITGTTSGSVTEDVSLGASGALSVTDADTDQATFQAVGFADTAHGSYSVDPSGNWSYSLKNSDTAVQALAAGATLSDGFTVKSADGTSVSISIMIHGTNDEPVANSDANASVDGVDTSVSGNVLTNDTDVDHGDSLNVTSVELGVNLVGGAVAGKYGTLTLAADGSYTYVSNGAAPAGAPVVDTFTYTVSDHHGGSDAKFISFEVSEGYKPGSIAGQNGWTVGSSVPYDQSIVTTSGVQQGWQLTRQTTAGSFGDQPFSPALGQTAAEPSKQGAVTSSFEASWTMTPQAVQTGAEGSYIGVAMDDGTGARGNLLRLENDADGNWVLHAFDYDSSDPDVDNHDFTDHVLGVLPIGVATKVGFTQQFVDGPGDDGAGNDIWTVYLNDQVVYTGTGWENYFRDAQPDISPVTYDRLLFRMYGASVDGDQGVIIDDVSYTTNQQSTLSISVTGQNAQPGFDGVSQGDVTEDGPEVAPPDTDPSVASVATGQVTITDADAGESFFIPASGNTPFGSYSFSADGHWTYTLDNTNETVQALASFDDTFIDTFTALSLDGSDSVTVSITVHGTNDSPIALDGSISTAEDASTTGGTVVATDVDNGSILTYSKVSNPHHGTVTIDPDTGDFTYTPNHDFFGDDSFTFKANDGKAESNIGTVTINVRAVNDPPIANDQDITSNEDEDATGTVTAIDVDTNNLQFILPVQSTPEHGSVTIDEHGNFTYTPDLNYVGPDSFTFQAFDGEYYSEPATVSITVNAVNDAPVASDSSESTAEDTLLSSTVSASDVDNLASELRYTVDHSTTHGTLKFNEDGTYTYLPDQDFNGSDTFTFIANDGYLDSIPGTVTITVTAVNDAPVAKDINFPVTEDSPLSTYLDSASDVDNTASQLTYSVVDPTINGTLTFSPDGTFTYLPNLNYNGPDSFSFQVSDGELTSGIYTVTLPVEAVNDDPVAYNDFNFVTEVQLPFESSATGNVLENDTDVEGDSLVVSSFHSDTFATGSVGEPLFGRYGTLTLDANGDYTYAPSGAVPDGVNLGDTFIYTVSDQHGGTSLEAVLTILVTGTNNDASVSDDSTSTGDVTEDDPKVASGKLVIIDPDIGEAHVQTASGTTDSGYGSYAYSDSDHTWTYTLDSSNPDVQALGSYDDTLLDTFTLYSHDGTTSQGMLITIHGTNDAPVAIGQSISTKEDTPTSGTVVATDVDNNTTLKYSIVNNPAHGTVVITNADTGAYTYTPSANYNGTDSFTFKANDGTADSEAGTVAITVTAVNDAPDSESQTIFTFEDEGVGGTVHATDVEHDTLTYSVFLSPGHGSLTFNSSTGAFSYVPYHDFNGTDGFLFFANDGKTDGDLAAVTIVVAAVNDAPFVISDEASVDDTTVSEVSGANVSGNVLSNDFDVDNAKSSLVVYSVNGVTGNVGHSVAGVYGTLTLGTDGGYTYVSSGAAPAGDTVTDSFTYKAADPLGAISNSTTLVITIQGKNDVATIEPAVIGSVDPPVTGSDSGDVTEDDPTTATGTFIISDPDLGESHSLSQNDPAPTAYGSYTVDSDGTWIYTLDSTNENVQALGPNDQPLTDSFSVVSLDLSYSVTVNISIHGTNDAPVAAAGSLTTDEDVAKSGTLLATDVDSASLTYSILHAPTHGTVVLTDAATGAYTYTPAANYNGTDSFTFQVSDGLLSSVDPGTVSITVTAVNDAPVAADGNLSTDEDTANSGTLVATDIDSASLTYSIVSNGTYGTVVITDSHTGAYTYTPSANYNGTDSFTFKANDGALNSNTATVSITIAPVNDAPVAAAGSLATDEDTAKSGTLVATDIDSESLTYSIVDSPAHGTVLITNTATGAYTYTPAADFNGADSFTFKANDGFLNSTKATVTISITAVNDAPVAATGSLTTAEDTAKNGTLVATDIDSASLTYSIVDSPAHGTVVITNAATGAYTYTPAADFNGDDSFTFKANDGFLNSNTATVSITITAVNDAPVAADSSPSTLEDRALSSTVSASDVDNTADQLSYIKVSGPSNGSLTFNADGSYTYTPASHYNGTDSFTFKANDGQLDSNVATVSITVISVNNPPVASNSSVTTNEDTLLSSYVSASDVDNSLSELSYGVVVGPTHGTLTFHLDGSYTYLPGHDFNGTDGFTFQASDGRATSNVGTVTISVTPVNDAPVAAAGSFTTDEDTANSGTLVATDIDSASLTYSIVVNGTYGTVVITDAATGAYTYTPAANYNGTDSFTFKANDGALNSNTATVSISITAVNDAPVAAVGSLTTNEDTAKSGALVATDIDSASLTYTIVDNPTHGTVVITNAATGAYTYTPAADFNGADSFTFKANDGALDSNTATVSISITAVNDAPVAAAGSLTTDEDTANSGTLVATDIDSASLTYSIVANGTYGTVVITDAATGAYTYTPSANYNGKDSFTFKANDGALNSNTATVSISITAVNDAPVAAVGSLTTNEDTANSGTLVATDIDSASLTYSVVDSPAHGTVVITNVATGAYTYTPAADFNGADSFTFKANDGALDSNTATVSIAITAVNDAPVAAAGSLTTDEDTANSGTLVATDIDSASLTYSIVANGAHGTVVITDAATGAYSYTPAANYNGTDSFTFKANDGALNSNTATVSISITAVNDAPVAAVGSLTTNEDTANSGTLVATDIDSASLTYSVVGSPAHGTVVITNAATGAYTYTPAADFNGADSFTFKANDGALDSNTATVSITITPVNDAPVAAAGSLTTNEDTSNSGTLVATDIDSASLTYSIVDSPAHGTVVINNAATGAYTYTPAANFNGTDSFTFKANDGALNSTKATVTISITAVNDAPSFTAGANITTTQDSATYSSPWATSISAGPSDESGQAVNFVVTNTNNALFSGQPAISSTGVLSFTPAAGATGTATVSVTLHDNGGTDLGGHDDSSTQTFTITLTSILSGARLFDMGYSGQTVPSGYVGVTNTTTYTAAQNYGWVTGSTPSGYYGPKTTTTTPTTPTFAALTGLLTDANTGTQSAPGIFRANLAANTTYEVIWTFGDTQARDNMAVEVLSGGSLVADSSLSIDPSNSNKIINQSVSGPISSTVVTGTVATGGTRTTTPVNAGNWQDLHFLVTTDVTGALQLKFSDATGGDDGWVVNALAFVPVSTQTTFTINAPITYAPVSGPLTNSADASKTDSFTVTSGFTPSAIYEVTSTLGSSGSTDGDNRVVSFQIQAPTAGSTFTIPIRRPYLTTSASGTITVKTLDGKSVGTFAVSYTADTATRKFDFNSYTAQAGATQTNATPVYGSTIYSTATGYGWQAPTGLLSGGDAVNETINPTTGITYPTIGGVASSSLLRDYASGISGASNTFSVNVPTTGTYTLHVTVYSYDPLMLSTSHVSMGVSAENGAVTRSITVNPNSLVTTTFDVTSAQITAGGNNTLDLTFSSTFGNFIVNGIDVVIAQQSATATTGTNPNATTVSSSQLQTIADAAIARFGAAGATTAQLDLLRAVQFEVKDLGGPGYLGITDSTSKVFIDDNGAGYGWYIDATPNDNKGFKSKNGVLTATGKAKKQMDLLSVVMHEFTNVLKLAGDTVPQGVSDAQTINLHLGQRWESPSGSALDSLFGGDELAHQLHNAHHHVKVSHKQK